MGGRGDLLLVKVEDRVNHGLALEVLSDVDVLPLHALTTLSAKNRPS
jgi:hypothetical protein